MANVHRANSKLSCNGFLVYTMRASLAICLASSLGGAPGMGLALSALSPP